MKQVNPIFLTPFLSTQATNFLIPSKLGEQESLNHKNPKLGRATFLVHSTSHTFLFSPLSQMGRPTAQGAKTLANHHLGVSPSIPPCLPPSSLASSSTFAKISSAEFFKKMEDQSNGRLVLFSRGNG